MPSSPSLASVPARSIALVAFLLPAACGGGAQPRGNAAADTGEYVVERSTAGGVETVRTVSGSRWGGSARLVEELSIGEELGDDAYLFGQISDAWATDERIYVVDAQVPAVRAYDHQGNFLHRVGGVGQGPGEYTRPLSIAVTADGRVLVTDLEAARLNVFDAGGKHVDDWRLGSPMAALGLQLAPDGTVYTRVAEMPSEMGPNVQMTQGMRAIGPDGHTGDTLFPPEIEWEAPSQSIDVGAGRRISLSVMPFTPRYQWVMAPGGAMIAGVGNEYRFEIHGPDGAVKAVEKVWEPVPVNPDEREFRAEMAAAQVRQMDPDFSIPTSDLPAHKPAFTGFSPDRSGRLWVARQGPSEPDPDCREGGSGSGMFVMMRSDGGTQVGADPGGDSEYDGECWRNTHLFDVFDIATGEFLGTVPAPEPGFTQVRFANDDTVLAAVNDELGTVRLKKYRLVID